MTNTVQPTLLFDLVEETSVRRQARMAYAESQLRQLCAKRGLDWDAMSEEEREIFIDDLLHWEARQEIEEA